MINNLTPEEWVKHNCASLPEHEQCLRAQMIHLINGFTVDQLSIIANFGVAIQDKAKSEHQDNLKELRKQIEEQRAKIRVQYLEATSYPDKCFLTAKIAGLGESQDILDKYITK